MYIKQRKAVKNALAARMAALVEVKKVIAAAGVVITLDALNFQVRYHTFLLCRRQVFGLAAGIKQEEAEHEYCDCRRA